MTRRIFLDIETLPPSEEERDFISRDFQFTESSKKKTAITGDIDAEVEQQFREMALHAEKGRLLTIGLIIEEDGRLIHQGLLGRDRETTGHFHLDEARTLKTFWQLVQNFNPQHDQIIGHNIFDFDLLFLFKRSVIQCVKPSIQIPFRRYQRQPIFDTMWEWSHWHHRISLHNLANALRIKSSKEEAIGGGNLYDYFLEGRHVEIASYCMRDVECTREVYYRLNFSEPPSLVSYAEKMSLISDVALSKTTPQQSAISYAA
jgi:3'-5' exonuclease